jgi:uncharacterized BrkB/YihY/UPF0761 family membrane protein
MARTATDRGDTVPRVYQPDHTADIRQRLKSMLLTFTVGAAIAVTGAIIIGILTASLDDQYRTVIALAWLIDIVTLLVAALGLLTTLIFYLIYRRRRAYLDAVGAEADGELRARIHRP